MTCSEGSDCRGADTAGFKIEGSELPICYFYDYSIWNQGAAVTSLLPTSLPLFLI